MTYTYVRIYNVRRMDYSTSPFTERVIEVEVELTIDADMLARRLAHSLATGKTGRAQAAGGAVKGKALRRCEVTER